MLHCIVDSTANFSPITEPNEPPIKEKSIQETTSSSPFTLPTALRTESVNLVLLLPLLIGQYKL